MNGKTLLYDLRQLLQEQAASSWMDDRTSYEYLYKGAVEFSSRTKIFTSTQTITTTAGITTYSLDPSFLEMAYIDEEGVPFIKYYDGSATTFVKFREYDPVILSNQTDAVSIPNTFSIVYCPDLSDITGTKAMDSYPMLEDESYLKSSDPLPSWTFPGDSVINVTDGSSGYIINTSAPENGVITVLWGGTNNHWVTNDSYIINRQGRFNIVLDKPSSTSGHTITVYYVKRPDPVYSPYRSYKIPIDYKQALIYYAAWMYKNRDREPNYAEMEYKYFEEQIKKACVQYGKALHRKGFRVNYRKRANEDSSWR